MSNYPKRIACDDTTRTLSNLDPQDFLKLSYIKVRSFMAESIGYLYYSAMYTTTLYTTTLYTTVIYYSYILQLYTTVTSTARSNYDIVR